MKRYAKEIAILILQLGAFYILPLFAGPTDMMGLVFLILVSTFALSAAVGCISKEKIKIIYPAVAAAIFIPSVFIFYNSTALVHSLWYLVVSAVGLAIGWLIRELIVTRAKDPGSGSKEED